MVRLVHLTACVLTVFFSDVTATRNFGGDCVSDCKDKEGNFQEGNFPHCNQCNMYVVCDSNGALHDRTCPVGTIWDGSQGCNHGSCTKTSKKPPQSITPSTVCPGCCVSSCTDKPDGNYQSCNTCRKYVVCHRGKLHEPPCPGTTEWDDTLKRCEHNSLTCTECLQPWECILKPDGDYQSCRSCREYIKCKSRNLNYIQCPAGTYWDNIAKKCGHLSRTCAQALTRRNYCNSGPGETIICLNDLRPDETVEIDPEDSHGTCTAGTFGITKTQGRYEFWVKNGCGGTFIIRRNI